MAEFDIARAGRHMCRGLVIFVLLVSNTMSMGNEQTVKAPVAIASVQQTRNSVPEVSFNETVRALSCFRVFLWLACKKCNDQEVKKKTLKATISNGIDGLGMENGKTKWNKTVTRIGVDRDDISILNLSPQRRQQNDQYWLPLNVKLKRCMKDWPKCGTQLYTYGTTFSGRCIFQKKWLAYQGDD